MRHRDDIIDRALSNAPFRSVPDAIENAVDVAISAIIEDIEEHRAHYSLVSPSMAVPIDLLLAELKKDLIVPRPAV